MSQQQIVVRPLGLITQPNKLGTYPEGALKFASGVFIRDPNVIEQAPANNVTYGSVPSTSGANAVFLLPAPNDVTLSGKTVLQIWDSAGSWRYSLLDGSGNNGNNSLTDTAGTNQVVSIQGLLSSFNMRGRQIINCTRAVLVFDHASSSSPTPRNPNLIPAIIAGAPGIGGSTGPAYPAGNMAHYTAVVRRVFSDGYELVSAPSAATCLYASGGIDTAVTVWTWSAYHQAGDIVDLYRTHSQPVGTNTGADFYLVGSYTLTSTDISNGSFTFREATSDETLGESLYTNPGQQGEDGASMPPPQCKCMATFKGHAFYFNCTDPPKIILRIGTFLGVMGTSASGANAIARKNGIGSRDVVGTVTVSSPTITAISAADIVGIKVGQAVINFRFNGGATCFVTAVGASSITLDHNATTGAGTGLTISVYDTIEVNGGTSVISDAEGFGQIPLSVGGNQSQVVIQALDRVLPANFGAGITNPHTTFAEGVLISGWFLTDGHSSSLTIRATNGANYIPQLPETSTSSARTITETKRPNGMSWSEQNQPERVCPLSTAVAGAGELYAAYSTRDAIWIFASDGLWRLSGTGGSAGDGYDWRIDPVDSTLSLSGPQAGCVLRDTVYAYTNRGFVSIDSAGNIREISQGRVNNLMPGPPWSTPNFANGTAMWTIGDETHDEVLLIIPGLIQVFVYNIITDTFTQLTISTSANFPLHAAYVRKTEEVIYSDIAANSVIGRSGGNAGAWSFMTQPLYGENPFVMRHWQTVNFVLDQAFSGQFISPFINGTFYANQTPTLFADSGFQRVAFTVPRNAPALANQIAVGAGGVASGTTLRRIFAVEVDYVDLSDQRRKRA